MNKEKFSYWLYSGYRNGTLTYVMKYDLGENWSLYHKTILEIIFKEAPENVSVSIVLF